MESIDWKGEMTDAELLEIFQQITESNLTVRAKQRISLIFYISNIRYNSELYDRLLYLLRDAEIDFEEVKQWKTAPIFNVLTRQHKQLQEQVHILSLQLVAIKQGLNTYIIAENIEKYITDSLSATTPYRQLEKSIIAERSKIFDPELNYKLLDSIKLSNATKHDFSYSVSNIIFQIEVLEIALQQVAITLMLPELQALSLYNEQAMIEADADKANMMKKMLMEKIETSTRYRHNRLMQTKKKDLIERLYPDINYKTKFKYSKKAEKTSLEDLEMLLKDTTASNDEVYQWLYNIYNSMILSMHRV